MRAREGRSVALHAVLGGLAGGACALGGAALPAALAVLLLLVLPVTALLALRTPREEMRPLLALFVAAVVVRAGVALTIHYVAPGGFFALDDYKYSLVGMQLAQHWAGEGPFPDLLYGRVGYYAWNALLFTLLGELPLIPTLANAAIGSFTVLLSYAIARDLGGHRAGLVAALLAAFWPSLVLWSSLNLKDAFAIVAVLLALRGAQRLQEGWVTGAALQLASGLLLLVNLRSYLALIAGLAVALAWLLPRLRRTPLFTGLALLAVALLLPALGSVQELADETTLESLDRTRRNLALGASAYGAGADLSTPTGALTYLPVGVVYFLLSPAPWQLWNARQLLTLPEMLLWYALLPQVVRGLYLTLRERFAAAAPVAIFACFATVSYGLVEGNVGTAYRHRAQVLVLFLIFGAVGLCRRREAAVESAAPRSAAPLARSRSLPGRAEVAV